jgi:hypothetical protein
MFTPCATVYRSPGGVAHFQCATALRKGTHHRCAALAYPLWGTHLKMFTPCAAASLARPLWGTHLRCAALWGTHL